MPYEQLIYEPGPVARIILNRPQYRNALSRVLQEEIDAAIDAAAADQAVRVIVVSGNGPSFCAGLDRGSPPELADRERRPETTDPQERYERSYHMGLGRLLRYRSIPKPLIAAVQGHCINAGTMLIAGMDLVFASEDASFSFVDAQFPSLLDGPMTARAVKDVLFEGRPVTAQQALQLGFVSRVYATVEELERETLAYAGRLTERNAWQLAMIKHSINTRIDALGYAQALETASHALSLTRAASGPPNVGRRSAGGEKPQ